LVEGSAPGFLEVRQAGEHSLRITLKPAGFTNEFPVHPAVVERDYPAPELTWRDALESVSAVVAEMQVSVSPDPLTVTVTRTDGSIV